MTMSSTTYYCVTVEESLVNNNHHNMNTPIGNTLLSEEQILERINQIDHCYFILSAEIFAVTSSPTKDLSHLLGLQIEYVALIEKAKREGYHDRPDLPDFTETVEYALESIMNLRSMAFEIQSLENRELLFSASEQDVRNDY